MNFTREPVIETIITPKEGYKLLVRSSKASGQEEYLVDSVEVVSFGRSFFFRSLEKPKPFLTPVSDYEIVEVKETRVVLKSASPERSIKIGGGREAPPRAPREQAERSEGAPAEREEEPAHPRSDRRRDRRRHRRRRGGERSEMPAGEGAERGEEAEYSEPKAQGEMPEEGGGASDETRVSSSMFSSLFPPPPTLISETIGRYKDKDSQVSEGDILPEQVDEEEPREEKKKKKHDDDDDDSSGAESSQLSYTATTMSFVSDTSFTSFQPPFNHS